MKTTQFQKDIAATEAEHAYAKVLGGIVNGGVGDGGKDVVVYAAEDGNRAFQVKSSIAGAKTSLAYSIKFGRFIPLLVGEPGTEEEILESVRKYGAWVEEDAVGRQDFLVGTSKVRSMIES